MNKPALLTMEEIEARFDGEWVLIEEPLTDGDEVLGGLVTAHSADGDAVYASARARNVRDAAVLFIGCSPFEGDVALSHR